MPIIDMALAKLQEYKGINPCPADFDAFWDKSVEEVMAIDPEAKFEPYPMNFLYFDAFKLTFKSTKGATIYCKVVQPKNITEKLPAVLHFHGLSGSSDPFTNLLHFAAQGVVAVSMDCRGQGGLSEDVGGVPGTTFSTPFTRGLDGKPEDLLVRDTFLDTVQLARVVMNLDYVDETRVAATGGSQGGGLTLACAALVPTLKMAAANYPYLSDYRRVWNMDLDKGAYEGIRWYFRAFDPAHEREEEIFEKLGYIDVHNLAHRIKAKVLMSTGLMDTCCPPSTQFAIYNNMTCEKEIAVYPDYAHEIPKQGIDRVTNFLSDL